MQPYLFPYIGYFQLITAVDRFVVYDDVNYIKQGWVNRNNILVQGQPYLFTLPLKNASSFAKINEIQVNEKLYGNWKKKFLRTLQQSYNKAPYFKEAFDLISSILDTEKKEIGISELATSSILKICNYLSIETEIAGSSTAYKNDDLSGQDRVLDICKKEEATEYINPIGGQKLYSKKDFEEQGIELNFVETVPVAYEQFNHDFIPALSIIDVLMFNSPETIKKMLDQYRLI